MYTGCECGVCLCRHEW